MLPVASFTLRRIIWSLDPEDYSVRVADQAVGRIYHTTGGTRGDGFAWFVYGSSRSGFASTLEQAKAEWREAYQRVSQQR
jgi:hypothetical protein